MTVAVQFDPDKLHTYAVPVSNVFFGDGEEVFLYSYNRKVKKLVSSFRSELAKNYVPYLSLLLNLSEKRTSSRELENAKKSMLDGIFLIIPKYTASAIDVGKWRAKHYLKDAYFDEDGLAYVVNIFESDMVSWFNERCTRKVDHVIPQILAIDNPSEELINELMIGINYIAYQVPFFAQKLGSLTQEPLLNAMRMEFDNEKLLGRFIGNGNYLTRARKGSIKELESLLNPSSFVMWQTSPGDNCEECASYSGMILSVYDFQPYGIFPKPRDCTLCASNCRCDLIPVPAPDGDIIDSIGSLIDLSLFPLIRTIITTNYAALPTISGAVKRVIGKHIGLQHEAFYTSVESFNTTSAPKGAEWKKYKKYVWKTPDGRISVHLGPGTDAAVASRIPQAILEVSDLVPSGISTVNSAVFSQARRIFFEDARIKLSKVLTKAQLFDLYAGRAPKNLLTRINKLKILDHKIQTYLSDEEFRELMFQQFTLDYSKFSTHKFAQPLQDVFISSYYSPANVGKHVEKSIQKVKFLLKRNLDPTTASGKKRLDSLFTKLERITENNIRRKFPDLASMPYSKKGLRLYQQEMRKLIESNPLLQHEEFFANLDGMYPVIRNSVDVEKYGSDWLKRQYKKTGKIPSLPLVSEHRYSTGTRRISGRPKLTESDKETIEYFFGKNSAGNIISSSSDAAATSHEIGHNVYYAASSVGKQEVARLHKEALRKLRIYVDNAYRMKAGNVGELSKISSMSKAKRGREISIFRDQIKNPTKHKTAYGKIRKELEQKIDQEILLVEEAAIIESPIEIQYKQAIANLKGATSPADIARRRNLQQRIKALRAASEERARVEVAKLESKKQMIGDAAIQKEIRSRIKFLDELDILLAGDVKSRFDKLITDFTAGRITPDKFKQSFLGGIDSETGKRIEGLLDLVLAPIQKIRPVRLSFRPYALADAEELFADLFSQYSTAPSAFRFFDAETASRFEAIIQKRVLKKAPIPLQITAVTTESEIEFRAKAILFENRKNAAKEFKAANKKSLAKNPNLNPDLLNTRRKKLEVSIGSNLEDLALRDLIETPETLVAKKIGVQQKIKVLTDEIDSMELGGGKVIVIPVEVIEEKKALLKKLVYEFGLVTKAERLLADKKRLKIFPSKSKIQKDIVKSSATLESLLKDVRKAEKARNEIIAEIEKKYNVSKEFFVPAITKKDILAKLTPEAEGLLKGKLSAKGIIGSVVTDAEISSFVAGISLYDKYNTLILIKKLPKAGKASVQVQKLVNEILLSMDDYEKSVALSLLKRRR